MHTAQATDSASGSSTADVSLPQGVAYSLPVFVTSFLATPSLAILPSIYAKHFGLALTTIAIIMMVGRLFDAITDPIIGYLSDRYTSRTGTRKPWVIIGGVCFVISGYYLFTPPADVSASYFLVWFLAFYLSWTLIEIPHMAWGGELASSSSEKTNIYGLRFIAVSAGALIFYVMPLLPFFETNEFTPETLRWIALVTAALMLPLLYLCVKTVPDGRYIAESQRSETLHTILNSIIGNKPLLIFLCSYFFAGIGIGMWVGTSFIFIDTYLSLGEKYPAVLSIAVFSGILSVRLWSKLADWLGKKLTWAVGMAMLAMAYGSFAFLQPDNASLIRLSVTTCFVVIGSTSMNIFAPALISDIVDYGMWKFGVNRGATYFAAYTFMTKANIGIGTALGLGIAGWFGLDPVATTQSAHSVFGLHLATAYTPMTLVLASIIFIVLIPINASRHAVIQRRLAMRLEFENQND